MRENYRGWEGGDGKEEARRRARIEDVYKKRDLWRKRRGGEKSDRMLKQDTRGSGK